MRRRTRLAAIVAALFALQAPLCAAACLDAADPAASALDAEPPCHGDDATSPPTDDPRSHEDCGCEPAKDLLAEVPDDQRPVTTHGLLIVACSSPYTAEITRSQADFVARQTDLPPPDILLLNTTLLV